MTSQLGERISAPSQSAAHVNADRSGLSVCVLFIVSLIDRIEEITLSILWPQMYRSLGATVGQLGLVLAVSQLVGTLLLPLWGYAVDRYSRKQLLVWFTGFWGVWSCVIALVETVPQLLLVRTLSALGLSVFTPAAFSLIGDLIDKENRGRSIGILRAAPFFGAPVAFIGLPALAAQSPEAWRWGFVLMGLASFVSGLIMLLLREPVRGRAEPELRAVLSNKNARQYTFRWSELRTLLTIRTWWWLGLREVLGSLSVLVFFRWFFSWLDELGLSQRGVVIFLMMLVATVAGFILFGWLGDRLEQKFPRQGRIPLALVGLIVQLISLLLLFTAGGNNVALLSVFGSLFALGFAATADGVLWPLGQAVLPPELRGSGQAFIAMAAGVSGAIVMAASGLVADRIGVAAMLLLFTPLPVLVGIVAWLPMFRTYPLDREALHRHLVQRRAEVQSGTVQ